jgi:hypothetical protein
MNSRETLLARARHQTRAAAESVANIEAASQQMDALVSALDQRVAAEERRTRIADVNHFAYSPVARSAHARAVNLRKSIAELEAKLLVASAHHDGALANLSALEKNRDAAQFVQIPPNNPMHKGRRRLRSYERRCVIVSVPSNENLADTTVTRTDATSTAQ